MTQKTTYFDPQSMMVGHVADTDGETWFHSTDGTMSREVGEGEVLIPYSEFCALLAQMQQSLMQRRDNILTVSGQSCNDVVTASRQNDDNITTRRDTSSARAARRKPPTAKQICKAHAEAVEMLKNAKFIRETSNGTYRDFQAFPTNVPQYIVDEINRRGIRRPDGREYTQETLSPVVAAMKITSRPSLFRVCYLIVLAVLVSVIVTKVWFWIVTPDGGATDTPTAEQNKTKFDFDYVKQIAKQNQMELTDYRVGLIVQKSYPDEAALVEEIKRQYADMLNTIQRRQK